MVRPSPRSRTTADTIRPARDSGAAAPGPIGDGSLERAIGKKQPFRDPHEALYVSLARTQVELATAVAAALKPHGLSEASYNVLRILRGVSRMPEDGRSSLRCGDVAQRMVTRAADLTRLVDRLVAAGWVERDRDPDDRRAVVLAITDAGLELVDQLDAPLASLHAAQFGGLDEDQHALFMELLATVRAAAPDPHA